MALWVKVQCDEVKIMNDDYKYEAPNSTKICLEAFCLGCLFSVVPTLIFAILYYIVLF